MNKLYPLFKDVFGQEKAVIAFKDLLQEIRLSKIYAIYNQTPTKGIILSGPKGVGKTSLVRALANELESAEIPSAMFHLSYLDIANAFVDRPLENLRAVFQFIESINKDKHVILFVDEIDGMLPTYNEHTMEMDKKRVVAFLEWMDGGLTKLKNVTVLGATNNIAGVHNSILRPGRFDRIIEFVNLKPDNVYDAMLNHLSESIENYEIIASKDDLLEKLDKGYNGADAEHISNLLVKYFIRKHIEIAKAQNIDLTNDEEVAKCKPPVVIDLDIFNEIMTDIKPSENRQKRTIGFTK